jgi:hypothetical protein
LIVFRIPIYDTVGLRTYPIAIYPYSLQLS